MGRHDLGGTPCPQDPSHGPLMLWNGQAAAWFCPNHRHEGTMFYDMNFAPVNLRANAPASTVRKVKTK